MPSTPSRAILACSRLTRNSSQQGGTPTTRPRRQKRKPFLGTGVTGAKHSYLAHDVSPPQRATSFATAGKKTEGGPSTTWKPILLHLTKGQISCNNYLLWISSFMTAADYRKTDLRQREYPPYIYFEATSYLTREVGVRGT